MGRLFGRWACKALLFFAITLVVLNPNLPIALQQVQHTLRPESLIQPDFAGISDINRELDALLNASTEPDEPKAVAKYVLKKIRYVSDYENWSNIEYWPTAAQVWSKRQEDCDGRAILAASILRSRGYSSARLVVGLKHMWIQVDQNEKLPSASPKMISLLGPERDVQLELKGNPKADHYLRLAKSFLQPTALRETSADLIGEIPPVRKAILIFVLLLLCYHPCKCPRGVVPVLVTGLASADLLSDWSVTKTSDLELIAGISLLAAGVLGAWLMERFGWRPQPRLAPINRSVAGIERSA